jgi:hypothetical protein
VNTVLTAVNVLREKAGLPPRQPFGGGGGSSSGKSDSSNGTPSSIKHDTFFGKKMGTAARQYLEMRYALIGDSNPAKPKEILEALKTGGFVFETKDDGVAIISLRNMLRKSSATFQKLPNGTYGLCSWYGIVKKAKPQSVNEVEEPDRTEDASPEELELGLEADVKAAS